MRLRWAAVAAAIAGLICLAWLLARREPGEAPVLTLRVEAGRAARVNAGTPLVFEVAVTARGEEPVAVGGFARSWVAMIALEAEDGTPLRDLVPRRSGWKEIHGGPAGFAVTSGRSSRAILSPQRVQTLVLQALPGATESLGAGTHRIHAVLRSPFWMPRGWRGEARSAAVTVEVRRSDPALEPRRLAETAALYLRDGRAADADPLARELLRLRPGVVGPLVLAGDVDAALGRWAEALARYREALALAPVTREEPDALYTRMARARRHLADAASGQAAPAERR